MSGFKKRRIKQLSGGQQQRIAIARALDVHPDLPLPDEPFSSLDEPLRYEMPELLADIQEDLKLTCIFITHDRHGAIQLANRIADLVKQIMEQVRFKLIKLLLILEAFFLKPELLYQIRQFSC